VGRDRFSQLDFTRVEMRKEYVRIEVWFHVFLILSLVGDELSTPGPALIV
jgi:hypothetical protein